MLILNCGFWGRGSEVGMCVCHHLRLLPAHLTQCHQPQMGSGGYSFYNSTRPHEPPWISYIYMHIHMHVHIYIFPSLLFGVEQLVKGKLRFGTLVLWGCGLVCAVPWLLSLAPLPRILQFFLSSKVSPRTQHIAGTHQRMLSMSKGAWLFSSPLMP